uniref:Ig-like domain-containing protein n=1 Tax=Salarias fasciatus TaxID=181472 RepID=A0A672H9G4_SALFA
MRSVTPFQRGPGLLNSSHRTTPLNIHSKPGEQAEIYCSHSIDSYNQILWYKQSQGELQLLGYIYFTDGNPEPGLDVKMHGDANKNKNSTLTMEKLQVSSSAVYFCAATTLAGIFFSVQYLVVQAIFGVFAILVPV